MASSESQDVVAEPPKKRQRLSPPPSTSYSTQLEAGNVAKMENTVKQTVMSDTGFQPEREKEVGILHFVNEENRGFTGTLKQRYTDFLVNEIAPDGSVVHLTDDRAPKFKNVAKAEDDSKPLTGATNDSASSTTNGNTHSPGIKQEAFPPPSTPIKSENVFLTTPADGKATPSAPAEVPVTPLPIEEPAKHEQKVAFEISPTDHELLVKYFGATLKDELVTFHEKVLSKPSAKPSTFGSLLSEPIADRPLRGRLHRDIRRIFESRIETESIEESKIRLSAAPPIKPHPESHVKKENPRQQNSRNQNQPRGKLGWRELGGEYLHFSLYKENKDTMEVISYLCRSLKVKPKDFAFAGTKDRRAVTVQRVSVFRQHANTLQRLNPTLRQARIGDFKHEKNRLELGELDGNEFLITLRDCHFGQDEPLHEFARLQLANDVVGQAVQYLQAHGFINYFGLQRFGTFGIGTDEIGKKILMNDFEGAVELILSFTPETLEACNHPEQFAHNRIGRDDLDRAWAINNFKQTGRSRQALDRLPKKFSAEANIMRHLGSTQHQADWSGALLTVTRNLRTMYVHAYQSLVWNTVASKRWERHGNKVIDGDLVLVDTPAEKAAEVKDEVDENGEIVIHPATDDVAVSHDDLFQRARALTAEEAESGEYTVFDVVLPTPGFDIEYPHNDIGDYYKEFMGSDRGGRLDPADMRRKIKDFSLSGSYRKLLGQFDKDMSFEVKTYYDVNEQLVETDLEKLQKSRGQDPRVENAPGNQDYDRSHNGFRDARGGHQNSRGGRGGRQNDFYNRPNGRQQQENAQPSRQERPSFRDHPNLQQTTDVRLEENKDPRLSDWQNLPAKLAADDKAAAAAYEASRLIPRNVDDIKQPIYKDSFIETSATNEGRRTGYRSTEIVGAGKVSTDEVKVESAPAEDIVMEDSKVAEPVAIVSEVMEVDPQASVLLDEVVAENNFDTSFASLGSSNDSNDGGVRLSAKTSPTKLSLVENATPAVESVTPTTALAVTADEEGDVKILAHESPIKRSAAEISTATAAETSKLNPESSAFEQSSTMATIEKPKSPLKPESPTFAPEPKTAKIAVIIKFALGTSQYATMALRELMKSGGVKTYKPDFSSGR